LKSSGLFIFGDRFSCGEKKLVTNYSRINLIQCRSILKIVKIVGRKQENSFGFRGSVWGIRLGFEKQRREHVGNM
jgi:hypothetical protein